VKKISSYFKNFSLPFVAFLQAVGLVVYCGLVGTLFWRGDKWFGPMNHYLGPVLLLIILVISLLICGLLALGYPVILFWKEKQTTKAIKLVACTTGWLAFFILSIIAFLLAA